MPHAASTGSARAAGVHLEHATRPETGSPARGHPARAGYHAVELLADGLAHPRDRRLDNAASAPSASASVASTSRTDKPRTNPAITNDSNAFDLVTPLPNSREANGSVVPRSFGRCHGHRPGGGLDRGSDSSRCGCPAAPPRTPPPAGSGPGRETRSTSASTAAWMISRAPSRATSSMHLDQIPRTVEQGVDLGRGSSRWAILVQTRA